MKYLGAAPCYLCHLGFTRNFWITALCIDQSSISEHNLQVRRMETIHEQPCGVAERHYKLC